MNHISPPRGGGTVTWPMNNKKSIGITGAEGAEEKFRLGSEFRLLLCGVRPPWGWGESSFGDSPPGGGGELSSLGGGGGVGTPPPPCANTGQVLVPGPKVQKHGVPVFGQARVSTRHVLRNTSCRHRGTGHAQVKEATREPHPRVKVIVWGRRHAPEVHDALVHARCDPKLEQAQTHCLCTAGM